MQEVFEKIIEKLEEIQIENTCSDCPHKEKCDEVQENISDETTDLCGATIKALAIEIVKQTAAEYNNGWIPCSVAMPPVETEVLIVAKRKYRGGEVRYITTTAMYEDGTVLENDSCWRWEDIEGEWDEENDCYIIPEGWWEDRHYNPDEVYNNAVDDEVVAWQPLPQPYQPKGE